MLVKGCRNILSTESNDFLNIISEKDKDGNDAYPKKLCARRDNSYKLVSSYESEQIRKPVKDGEDYVCKEAGWTKKCGGQSADVDQLMCIKDNKICPISKVEF